MFQSPNPQNFIDHNTPVKTKPRDYTLVFTNGATGSTFTSPEGFQYLEYFVKMFPHCTVSCFTDEHNVLNITVQDKEKTVLALIRAQEHCVDEDVKTMDVHSMKQNIVMVQALIPKDKWSISHLFAYFEFKGDSIYLSVGYRVGTESKIETRAVGKVTDGQSIFKKTPWLNQTLKAVSEHLLGKRVYQKNWWCFKGDKLATVDSEIKDIISNAIFDPFIFILCNNQ